MNTSGTYVRMGLLRYRYHRISVALSIVQLVNLVIKIWLFRFLVPSHADTADYTKLVQLPPFNIKLQLGRLSSESYQDTYYKLTLDLDGVLENYLLNQVSDRMKALSTFVSSLSLHVQPTVSSLPVGSHQSSQKRAMQASSIAFQVDGNVTLLRSSNVIQTDEALTQSMSTVVESSLSNGSSLLLYITSHASTATLKNILGVSSAINGYDYSSPMVNANSGNNSNNGLSLKRTISQIYAYALIGVAGLSIIGWIYLFYMRHEPKKDVIDKAEKREIPKRETGAFPKNRDMNILRTSPFSVHSWMEHSPLNIGAVESVDEMSQDTNKESDFFGDNDDDSFAMRLRKAILIDRQTQNFDSNKVSPSEASAINQIIPTLKHHKQPIRNSEWCDIPDQVDLDLELQNGHSVGQRDYSFIDSLKSKFSHHQSNSKSVDSYDVEKTTISAGTAEAPEGLTMTNPQFNPFNEACKPRTLTKNVMESRGTNVVNLVFKTRSSESPDRSIPMDEYNAAVHAAARQITEFSMNAAVRRISQFASRGLSNESGMEVTHDPVIDHKPNREAVLSKLRSLIDLIDKYTQDKALDSADDPSDYDERESQGGAWTDGSSDHDVSSGRLGIYPFYGSKDNICLPPSSLVIKKHYVNVSKLFSPLKVHES